MCPALTMLKSEEHADLRLSSNPIWAFCRRFHIALTCHQSIRSKTFCRGLVSIKSLQELNGCSDCIPHFARANAFRIRLIWIEDIARAITSVYGLSNSFYDGIVCTILVKTVKQHHCGR